MDRRTRTRLLIGGAALACTGVLIALASISTRTSEIGSSELSSLTEQLIGSCAGAGNLVYTGATSTAGEKAMLAGSQVVAPMARPLGSALCRADAGAPSQAAGLVVGLDSIDIVGSAIQAGTSACNGSNTTTCAPEAAGLVYSATVSRPVNGNYVIADWRDALRVLYTGRTTIRSAARAPARVPRLRPTTPPSRSARGRRSTRPIH